MREVKRLGQDPRAAEREVGCEGTPAGAQTVSAARVWTTLRDDLFSATRAQLWAGPSPALMGNEDALVKLGVARP